PLAGISPGERETEGRGELPRLERRQLVQINARNPLGREQRLGDGALPRFVEHLHDARRERARLVAMRALAALRVEAGQPPKVDRRADRIRLAGTLIDGGCGGFHELGVWPRKVWLEGATWPANSRIAVQ